MPPPPPLDLGAFATTPPYASELFGVYKPLLGWKSKQAKWRIEAGTILTFKQLARELAAERMVRGVVARTPRPIGPDDLLPARAPGWMGYAAPQAVAQVLADLGGVPGAVDWEHVVAAADLDAVIKSLAASSGDGNLANPNIAGFAGTEPTTTETDTGEVPDRPVSFKGSTLAMEATVAGVIQYAAKNRPYLLDAMFSSMRGVKQLFSYADPLENFDPDAQQLILSPLGLIDVYREYFFEFDSFLGPSVSHVWVSPGGGVELYEIHTRRTLEERELEYSTEYMSRSEKELVEEDELSTAIGEENSRDINMGASVNANVDFGVVQAGAEAHIGLNLTRQTSRQDAHKHARRQSEKLTNEIRRNFKSTFRTSVETEDTSSKRYVLQNDTDKLLNYELRRKMRRVGVQVHHIGTMLCWQLHVYDPGAELGVAELVHVAKPDDFGANVPPPEAPPEPDPKTSQVVVDFPYKSLTGADDEDDVTYYSGDDQEGGLNNNDKIDWRREYKAAPPAVGYVLADVKQLSADRVDPDEDPPQVSASFHLVDETTFRIDLDQVNFNDQPAIKFLLELIWSPPDNSAAKQEWEQRMQEYQERGQREAQAAMVKGVRERVKLAAGVERRPSPDLRKEERSVIFRRMMGQLTKVQAEGGAHVTAELVRSIFDIEKMLYFVAPDWWLPRKRIGQQYGQDSGPPEQTLTEDNLVAWGGAGAVGRDNYLITEESRPAPMGASLGWLLQLDGDEHRNAFLNSAWALAVLPVRPGRELAALNWLKLEHVEGTDGLDADYGGPEPELQGLTLGEALEKLAAQLKDENEAPENMLATETVYENGFDPLEGGFNATGEPFEVFDQWIEILPTEQVVALEYDTGQ